MVPTSRPESPRAGDQTARCALLRASADQRLGRNPPVHCGGRGGIEVCDNVDVTGVLSTDPVTTGAGLVMAASTASLDEDNDASAPMSVKEPATRWFPFQSVGSLASATTWSITFARVALLETKCRSPADGLTNIDGVALK